MGGNGNELYGLLGLCEHWRYGAGSAANPVPGPAWWRPPRAIVWLGALLILSVGQSVDAWPSWSIWLALATGLLMLLVMVQAALPRRQAAKRRQYLAV